MVELLPGVGGKAQHEEGADGGEVRSFVDENDEDEERCERSDRADGAIQIESGGEQLPVAVFLPRKLSALFEGQDWPAGKDAALAQELSHGDLRESEFVAMVSPLADLLQEEDRLFVLARAEVVEALQDLHH